MFRLTAAQLIDTGNCRACDIIRVFGVSKSSIDRAVRRYRAEGAEAFFRRRSSRRCATVLTPEVLEEAQRLLHAHASRRAVAEELEIRYSTLAKAIQDGRLHEWEDAPPSSAKSDRSVQDAQAAEGMGTGCTRPGERILTALGVLHGAPIRFEPCRDVPYGGVLCALPALLSNSLLSGIDRCLGKLSGYYHAFPVLLLLAFMALARIKTVESLRGKAPGEFGKLLGLDRIPEVRCLRKKMDQLSREESAERWAVELGRSWMKADPESVGALYVDGHVRVYHGGKTKPPRKYVARQRLCLRGSTDYWVNDAVGRPFFVIDKLVDPGLLKVLREDIVPRLLEEVPHQPSPEALEADPSLCRFLLVFDREGYSPAFFKEMWRNHRIGCITYHKYPSKAWPEESFAEQVVPMPNGETLTMRLAERGSLVGTGKDALWLREVRKLTKSAHQTSLISTAYGLEHTMLAARMFTRWCQENFFSYMMEHFAIELLSEYGGEDVLDTTRVVNPTWRELNRERNSVQNKLRYRQVRFAELTLHPAPEEKPSQRKRWQEKKADLLEDIQHFEQNLGELKSRLKRTKKHIQWDQLDEQERFQKPAIGRKRLMDTIKMIAYRAETAMSALITGPSADTAAARRLLQDLFTTEADIFPDPGNRRLLVSVHRRSRPAADRILARLFEQLNESDLLYPGTDLRIVYGFVGTDEMPQK
jgi:transposase